MKALGEKFLRNQKLLNIIRLRIYMCIFSYYNFKRMFKFYLNKLNKTLKIYRT